MFKTYAMLTKPGIILGNLITTAGAFAMASKGSFDLPLFATALVGLGLVIASACVFNNYIDRHIDSKMSRTQNRALAKGTLAPARALTFGALLGVAGFLVLALYVNLLSAGLAAAGFFGYVVMYSIWKYRSTYGTLIGSFAGAAPPVIGYTAASQTLDANALLLFLLLVLWQMPHFYAIAIYRSSDYRAAELPLLPILKGNRIAKYHMCGYIFAFIGMGYLLNPSLLLALAGLSWLLLCLYGFRTENDPHWARQMFRLSLLVIMTFSIVIGVA